MPRYSVRHVGISDFHRISMWCGHELCATACGQRLLKKAWARYRGMTVDAHSAYALLELVNIGKWGRPWAGVVRPRGRKGGEISTGMPIWGERRQNVGKCSSENPGVNRPW